MHRMSDGSEPIPRLASPFFIRSIHLRSVPSFILPQFGGSKARRRQLGEDEEGGEGPIIAPSSSSAPDQFAVFSSSSSPSVAGAVRGPIYPTLFPRIAEVEVTATNLGKRKESRDRETCKISTGKHLLYVWFQTPRRRWL